MKMNKKVVLSTLMAMFLCSSIFSNAAIADDDVAALVVDNGGNNNGFVNVPEPSTSWLLLIGFVGLGVAAYRNRKK